MGLGGDQFRRWQGVDGVPDAEARRAGAHAGGTLRRADGTQTVLAARRRPLRAPAALALESTGALYPVEADFEIRLPEGMRRIPLTPLFDAQELDGRATGMPSYWEGAGLHTRRTGLSRAAAVTPRTAGDPTTEPGPGNPATQPEWDIEPNDSVQSR